jgi:hypothetical protein
MDPGAFPKLRIQLSPQIICGMFPVQRKSSASAASGMSRAGW